MPDNSRHTILLLSNHAMMLRRSFCLLLEMLGMPSQVTMHFVQPCNAAKVASYHDKRHTIRWLQIVQHSTSTVHR
jgi:hypothetical protein